MLRIIFTLLIVFWYSNYLPKTRVLINMSTDLPAFVKCPDCDFISKSSGGLAVHQSKIHNVVFTQDVKTLYINRLFPEGNAVYCCLCDVIIGTVANFRRHMKTKHKTLKLVESAQCLICGKNFKSGRGAGVHIHCHSEDINKFPHSPMPVMTSTTQDHSMTPRRGGRLNSPLLTDVSNSIFTTNNDTVASPYHPSTPQTHRTPPSSSPSPKSLKPSRNNIPPSPIMIDLDSDDVPTPPSPPRPSFTPLPRSSSSHPSFSETLVTLSGSTVGDEDEIPTCTCQSKGSNPTQTDVLLSDPEVVLNDYNNGDDFTISPSSTPTTPLLPLPLDSKSSHNLSPEPMVALSGCTVHNQSYHIPTPSSSSQTVDVDEDARVSFTSDTVADSSAPVPPADEIPFHPNPDNENVPEFVQIWSSKITSASDFDNFCNTCEDLETAVVEKGKEMSNNNSG